MAALAVLIGAGSALAGLGLSLWQDTPAGPSIVACAAVAFAASALTQPLRRA
jgi:zinc transport system permease protein